MVSVVVFLARAHHHGVSVMVFLARAHHRGECVSLPFDSGTASSDLRPFRVWPNYPSLKDVHSFQLLMAGLEGNLCTLRIGTVVSVLICRRMRKM